MSQSVVSAIEAGSGSAAATIQRVCHALGGELRLEAVLPHGGEGPRQADAGHARCVDAVRRLLLAAGHECRTEQPIVDGHWRGSIDVVGFDRARSRLVVIEVKSELRDMGGLERQVARYARGCIGVARQEGWRVREVVIGVIVLATTFNDAFLVANRGTMAGAFPVRGREAIRCLLDGMPARGRILLMVDPLRRGRRALLRSMADGRALPAPHRDYRSFVAAAAPSGGGRGAGRLRCRAP